MFIQVKNYYVSGIFKMNNGVQFIIEDKQGNCSTWEFSTITLKFYNKFGKKFKMPKYLAKELISMANGNGLICLTDVEKENALYWL